MFWCIEFPQYAKRTFLTADILARHCRKIAGVIVNIENDCIEFRWARSRGMLLWMLTHWLGWETWWNGAIVKSVSPVLFLLWEVKMSAALTVKGRLCNISQNYTWQPTENDADLVLHSWVVVITCVAPFSKNTTFLLDESSAIKVRFCWSTLSLFIIIQQKQETSWPIHAHINMKDVQRSWMLVESRMGNSLV